MKPHAGCSPLSFRLGKAAAGIDMILPGIREAAALKERGFTSVTMGTDPEARQGSAHARAINLSAVLIISPLRNGFAILALILSIIF